MTLLKNTQYNKGNQIKMNKEDFFKLLERREKGLATERDNQIFDEFFDSFQEGDWDDWDLSPKERIKMRMYNTFQRKMDASSGVRLDRLTLFKVAASLAIVIATSFFIYTSVKGPSNPIMVTQRAPMGKRTTVELADGSQVQLNSGSSITYPERFQDNKRAITLEGEAYFQVRHNADKPFIVTAGEVNVRVLGTTFNIDSYNSKETHVTLLEGKVAVTTETDDEILKPGEQATFETAHKTLTKARVNVDGAIAWTKGELYFEQAPLTEVVQELSRWYDTEIILENNALHNCTISVNFKGEQLEDVLEGIRFLMDIRYTRTDSGKVLINGSGCGQ
ncbi:MAG: FecR domain-containing protein [Bacteroidota bacterium]